MQVYAKSFIYRICVPEMLNAVSCFYADQFAIIKQKYLSIYHPNKSDMYVVIANMHE